jgi:hypothetical protein
MRRAEMQMLPARRPGRDADVFAMTHQQAIKSGEVDCGF